MGENVPQRRERIVLAIEEFWAEHGYAPTRAQVAEIAGLGESTVRAHITALVQEGRLMEDPGHRNLRVLI